MTLPIAMSDKPNMARVDDYWLGGRRYTERDRKFADHATACAPHVPSMVRAQRALLGRMVRYLVGQGVRQFLDLGSGLPTAGHVHEIAQGIDPASRVVYVDNDPGVAADSRDVLAGNDNTAFLQVDLREPVQVLNAPEARRLLDLSEPIAVLLIATLQHIPDSDNPITMIATYQDAMCSGSYLAVSHFGPDEQLLAGYELFDAMNLGPRPDVSLRDQSEIASFFAGLELVEPGIVPMLLWHPDPDDDLWGDPQRLPIHAAVGRKP